MQRTCRQLSVLVLVLFVAALAGEPTSGALSLSKLKQQLEESSRNIRNVQAKLRPIKKKQVNAQKELGVAKNRLSTTERTLRDIQSQLQETRFRLSVTRAELERTRKRLKERNDQLSTRLVDIYKHGSISYMSVLLGATDFADLLNRGYIARKVMQKDVDLLAEIKEDEKRIAEYAAMLEDQEARRRSLEQKHTVLTRRAYTQTMDCRQSLTQIERQRAELERIIAAENAASAELGALYRKMQSSSKGARATEVWRGGLIKPVSGRITSPFGMRFHPILHKYRMHTGTDIAAPVGTPIKAAGGGVVILAGWHGGTYGYTVMIDHGGGLSTFYGHCSSVCVKYGQKVKQGQVIARVGSTGTSTGPHVHFEIQKNGVPQPP